MKRNQLIVVLLISVIAAGAILSGSLPQSTLQLTPATTSEPGVLSVTPTREMTATPLPADVIRLAWFYKPPESAQMELVLQQADFFILTHKDEQARSEMKARGISAPFSQYLLLAEIHDPGDCTKGPRGNQVAYKEGDFCAISSQHPDWFLLDKNGNRIGTEDTFYMDPGNEGYRAFWLERARELQETYGWEAVFLDNVEASRAKMVKGNQPLANYPDDESYQQAVEGFLTYIRQNYFGPRGKAVYGNIVSVNDDAVWDRYMEHLDGVMIESFATDWGEGYPSKKDWEEQMDQAQRALARGKTLILESRGSEKDAEAQDLELQNFAFASYLLIADGNAYFRYTHGFYREWLMYENYNLDLGAPLGDRYKDQGGWRRDFENGYVIVKPQNGESEIVFNP
jgi:Hypothetical glycosyl hydrolase family 15